MNEIDEAASNCVNFVYKHDTRGGILRPFEKITHAACAYAHEHFNEL